MGYFIITMQRGRCPVSWHLQNQVDQNAQAGLYKSIYETAVMRALASFANDDGGSCFPSLETLMKRSGCRRTTLCKTLKEFTRRGWIRIKHAGRSNIYEILPHGCVLHSEGQSSPAELQKFASRTSEVRGANL